MYSSLIKWELLGRCHYNSIGALTKVTKLRTNSNPNCVFIYITSLKDNGTLEAPGC